jgi:hypothetical protein
MATVHRSRCGRPPAGALQEPTESDTTPRATGRGIAGALAMVAILALDGYAYDACSELTHEKRERARLPWINDCAINASCWYLGRSSVRLWVPG